MNRGVETMRPEGLLFERNTALLELVASGASLPDTLDRLVRMLEDHAEDELLASILLLDGTRLRHGAAPSLPNAYNDAIDGIEIGSSVGSCGTAAFTREPVYVRDIATSPLWADFRELALEHGLRSCWSTPITAIGGEILGTFAMYHREPRDPDANDLRLVQIATRTAAAAIERRRLEEDRERHLRVVEELNRVGLAINATLDLQDVVQVVTDAATELMGAEFGAFFYNVIRADGEAYTLYTLSGAPRSAFEKFPMPRNTAIFDPTFRGEGVVRIDDVKADPRYGLSAPYHGMPPGHLPVTSYLAAPVQTPAGEVLGGLFFGHKEPGMFTEEAERLLVGIAAQAAVAIERAHLHAQAELRAQAALSLRHVTDGVCLVDNDGIVGVWNPAAEAITGIASESILGKKLAASFDAFSGIGDAGVVRVDVDGREIFLSVTAARFDEGTVYTFGDRTEEHRLERVRSEMVATVSHELRTPLAAVYGAAQTLARPGFEADAQLRGDLIRMIVAETERLSRVAEQILQTSELERRPDTRPLDDIDVEELASRVVGLAGVRPGRAAVELDVEPGLRVVGHEDKLQQVLTNLLDNGIKYGGDRVVLRAARRGDRARLAVVDWGPGIPASEASRVFDRFYRLDPDQRGGVAGTGLGLSICRELVRQMRGEIWVERTEGGGATFVVDLGAAGPA